MPTASILHSSSGLDIIYVTIQRNITNSVKQNFHSEDQLNRIVHPSVFSAPLGAQGLYERRYPAIIIYLFFVLFASGAMLAVKFL